MRARNIKPGFFKNEVLGAYEPIIQLLFAGLWCLADRDGRLEDRPLRIKGELFPYRDNIDVNGYLTVMERDGFIIRYVANGLPLIQVCNFLVHQSPHNTEKAKNYPSPSNEPLTPLNNGEITEAKRPDSLIHGFTDSLNPENTLSLSVIVMEEFWSPSVEFIEDVSLLSAVPNKFVYECCIGFSAHFIGKRFDDKKLKSDFVKWVDREWRLFRK